MQKEMWFPLPHLQPSAHEGVGGEAPASLGKERHHSPSLERSPTRSALGILEAGPTLAIRISHPRSCESERESAASSHHRRNLPEAFVRREPGACETCRCSRRSRSPRRMLAAPPHQCPEHRNQVERKIKRGRKLFPRMRKSGLGPAAQGPVPPCMPPGAPPLPRD